MKEEQIKQKAKDFVSIIAGGTPKEMDYYADILAEFATEATKELQEEVNEWKENAECALKEQKMLQEKNGKLLQRIEQLEKDVIENESDCLICDFPKLKTDLEKQNDELKDKIKELEKQIEKLIHFVLIKTDCCEVCPITDTCINSEGTCPYASILSKDEEAVTRKWLIQIISKEIKENDKETERIL